jgi:hypothetical protein
MNSIFAAPLSSHFKVVVHDEAYALAHLGIIGQNLEFFVFFYWVKYSSG